jgi:hypothetical protein
MSLTSALAGPGPLRTWFELHLGNTAGIVRVANREITSGREPLDLQPRDRGAVGHAVDVLLRLSLRPDTLDRSVLIRTAIREVAFDAAEVGTEAGKLLGSLNLQGPPKTVDWRAAARASLVLAFMEQTRRSNHAMESVSLRVFEQPATIDGWLAVLATSSDIADVAALGHASVEDHLDLRAAQRLDLNPKFARSRDLGGADGDLIADGTLLDFKSTKTRSVVTREVLWQVMGYALADTDDEFEIRFVGVSALRWRRRWVRPLDELLAELGYQEDLPSAHTSLAAALRTAQM